MCIALLTVRLSIPWAQSLKEKRMVVRSVLDKAGNKFNVSVAEVDEQDLHQTAVLAFAALAAGTAQADSVLDHLLNYLERTAEAEITVVEREIR